MAACDTVKGRISVFFLKKELISNVRFFNLVALNLSRSVHWLFNGYLLSTCYL